MTNWGKQRNSFERKRLDFTRSPLLIDDESEEEQVKPVPVVTNRKFEGEDEEEDVVVSIGDLYPSPNPRFQSSL